MERYIKSIGLILFVCVQSSAMAGQNWCSGKITHTYLYEDGTLFINGDWRNQHTAICNINKDRQGISPDVCKSWLSIAMAAKLSEAKVIVYYKDVPSCSDIPQYGGAPNPGYLMLDN